MAAAETQALFQQLTILLALATASQFLFRRWHLPMIIGEIAVGIVLGPSVVGNAALGSYRYFFDPAVVRTLAVLGSIFLLFLIGLDFDFRVVYTRKNVAVASGGVVLPLLLGFATALYLVPVASIGADGTQFTMALFVGATLTATSVAITAAVLFELNLLKDRVAQTILGQAAGVPVGGEPADAGDDDAEGGHPAEWGGRAVSGSMSVGDGGPGQPR